MAKIFLTGATGYLGGETLYQLACSGAGYQISCLVRRPKIRLVSEAYPEVRVVEGDLDDLTMIEREARDADIVLHLASTNHLPSSKAIVQGLTASDRPNPGYWIQISGASLFSGGEIKCGVYGEAGGRFFDNLEDNSEILSTISSSPDRTVDNFFLSQHSSEVRSALIVGPLFYGGGRGPGNQKSMQGPASTKYTLQRGQGFRVGAGESVWSNVHIQDAGSLIALLVNAAASNRGGLWNKDGVYVPENGHMSFGELTSLIAKEAHHQGFISTSSIEVIGAQEADRILDRGAVLLATNAKVVESRARKYLGWQPSGLSIEDDIPLMVKCEAEALQLKVDPRPRSLP